MIDAVPNREGLTTPDLEAEGFPVSDPGQIRKVATC